MRILFLSDNFPPEVNAPASRTFEHCRLWAKAGHTVTVITGAPNFPDGKIFPGYRNRLWHWETMESVRVLRVWTYITANDGFMKRILDYLSFMAASIAGSFISGPADVVVGTSPQFFTACAAWAVSAIKRAPFVFELRDLWPESIKAVGAMKDGLALAVLERLELFLYRRAALIVSVTHSFKEILAKRGIDAGKVVVVTNGIDAANFAPRAKDAVLAESLGLGEKFVAGYIGTHGMAHGLETLLDAARQFQERGDEGVVFLFLGGGARKPALKEAAKKMGLRNVLFLDTVPKADVPRYWSLLDAAVIHLRRDPLFTTVIPSKLFESMGMGIPVLMGVEGEAARIVEMHGAGLCFTPGEPAGLVAVLDQLRGDASLRERLRSCGILGARKYDRNRLGGEMLAALELVTKVAAPCDVNAMRL